MGVPSSGPIRLRGNGDGTGISEEINGNVTGSVISLRELSAEAGFSSPDTMREFYGYVDAVIPSVTTNNNAAVSETTMTLNGNVTSDGGASVTSRGFYFGTNPTYTSNTKVNVGSGTGAFSTTRTGLSNGTTYYRTAFAINSVGEGIGATKTDTTQNPLISVTASSYDTTSCRYTYCQPNVAPQYYNYNTGINFSYQCQSPFTSGTPFSWNHGGVGPSPFCSQSNTCNAGSDNCSGGSRNVIPAQCGPAVGPAGIRTEQHSLTLSKSGYRSRSYNTYTSCIYCQGGFGPLGC